MKKHYWFLIISLPLFVLGIYIYKDAHIILETSKKQNFVKQQGITTTGYDNGKKVFKINIDELKQNDYRHILFSKHVTDGIVYASNGAAIIQNITGSQGRINTQIKSIVITKNVTALITPEKTTKNIRIQSNKFRYSHHNQISEFTDQASLFIETTKISSKEFYFYTEANEIKFLAPLQILTATSETNAKKAFIQLDADQLLASKNIKTIYKPSNNESYSQQIQELTKSPTTISADELELKYHQPETPTVIYRKNILITQPQKSLIADQVTLDFFKNNYQATGKIKFNFDDLRWLKNKDRTYKNKKLKSLLSKSTSIQTETATFKRESNILTLKNNVKIKQKTFQLSCDEFMFNFNTDIITASGNVIIKKLGLEHLSSDLLIIDVKNETFQSGARQKLTEITLDIID